MSAKRFFLSATALALAVLLLCAGALAALDPFFVVRDLREDQRAFFSNQRYEMAGLISRQDYSSLLMGTSLAANFRASWFTEGLGKPTLKLTFPNGWPKEFDKALRLAYETHPDLDTVFFGMDLNMLVRDPGEQDVDLPDYLYNTDPLDDAAYFLNKETYLQAMKSAWKTRNGESCVLDEAYTTDGTAEFSREKAMENYVRVPYFYTPEPAQPWIDIADRNLVLFLSWIEEHPETEFVFWCAPYSVMYWDRTIRTGRADAYLAALEHAWDVLSRYENVRLYSFLDREDIVTDLDNYTDYIHCSGAVARLEAESMMADLDPVTRENYRDRIARLRAFVMGYNYDLMYE